MNALRMTPVLLGLLLASSAAGQIRVDYLDGSNWINLSQSPATPAPNIIITDVGSRTYRVYALSPTTQSIGALSIVSEAGATPVLFVGQGLTQPREDAALSVPGANNIGAVSYTGGRPRLQLRVNGATNGEINFWHIVRLDAGLIADDVSHNPVGYPGSTAPRLGVISAGEIGVNNTTNLMVIKAARGDILRLEADFNIWASVECSSGSIGTIQAGRSQLIGKVLGKQIQALNGSIGEISAFGEIGDGPPPATPMTIKAKNGINVIQSIGVINANITANANNGTGDVGVVEALGFDVARFFGSIRAHDATGLPNRPAIYLEGDCIGDITLSSTFSDSIYIAGDLNAAHTISIAGGLAPGASIRIGADVPTSCLAGQIIINAANAGGAWSPSASITVCANPATTLSPVPAYANTPSSIGGGAVGEAPFNFHAAACTPAHNSATPVGSFPDTVVVRHYGPVLTLGTAPLRVFARPVGRGGSTWTEYTNNFTYTVGTSSTRRNVSITKNLGGIGWAANYDYMIVPVTDLTSPSALRCLDVANKPAVRAYEYTFRVTE